VRELVLDDGVVPAVCRKEEAQHFLAEEADLAAGAGYFDQAHFGHEFRAFTGLTPTRYVEVRRRFLREHPGHVLDSWPLPAD
jgi:AraC-like DNA-binding protein